MSGSFPERRDRVNGELNQTDREKTIRRLAIIRPSSYLVSPADYNIQELGLAKGLSARGISSDIYMAGRVSRPEVSVIRESPQSVRLIRLPFWELPGKQALFPDLNKLLRQERYDVIQVHEYNQITTVLVSAYARRRGIPVVLCQGMYIDSRKILARLLQPIYDIVVMPLLRTTISLPIAKTSRAAGYLRQKGFQDLVVCPVGLDTDAFTNAYRIDVRAKYGLTRNDRILLYVGNLEKRRNPAFLIRIFQVILQSCNDIVLLIAGDGMEKATCEKLAKTSVGKGRITFIGRVLQDELPSLYEEAYLFLLPSSYEIYGMVIMEAMYFGVPVITTSTAGSMDLIQDGTDGVVLDGLDMDSWTKTIVMMLRDKERRDSLAAAAKAKICRHYDWEHASGRYLDSYNSLLASAITGDTRR
jgi:glycosyltransferase involved in cell wall biosynthesis